MITRITINDCVEAKPHHFVTEASLLGWPPGKWPVQLTTDLGNGRPFYAYHHEIVDGDLLWVDYVQPNGLISLHVLND